MEELDAASGSTSGATSKKSSKKSSKHHNVTPSKGKVRRHHNVALPPSIAERPKSPLLVHGNPSKQSSRSSERYSGLWECYYDQARDDVMLLSCESGDGVRGEGQGSRLKNIRGFLLKRRKSPLKGWHKRYFMLEQGTLYFSRSHTQMQKGKVLGSIDLGLSFIHTDAATRRIDIDGEHQVLHLKTKNPGHFTAWSSCLLSHEMYRKTQLAAGTAPEGLTQRMKGGMASTVTVGDGESLDSWAERTQTVIGGVRRDLDVIRDNLEAMSVYVRTPAPNNQSASSTTAGITPFPHTSSSTDLKLSENGLDNQSVQSVASSSEGGRGSGGGAAEGTKGDSGSGGKIKKKFRKGKQDKKSKESSNLSPEQVAPYGSTSQLPIEEGSVSSSAASDTCSNRDDFTATAKIIYAQFCELIDKLDKVGSGLNQVVRQTNSTLQQQEMMIHNHQLLLRQSLLQSNELRDRLSQIQQLASGVDTPATVRGVTPGLGTARRTPSQSFHGANISRFDSYMSLQSSLSEKFFDALDDLRERSSESEEEEETLNTEEEESAEEEDEESDSELYTSLTQDVFSAINLPPTPKQSTPSVYTLKAPSEDVMVNEKVEVRQRRTKLPCPMQDMGDFSLWSILRKNIGKDLSKISMPVTLNEPLSALQRLCEELEFSELLDEASSLTNIYDRMVKVAAFAVSSFALNFHRAGRKPFNPILGETYECVREDKGFKFIAEQVSHHPPIAACHCTSPNFQFWQDARIKSKFWGKSMEVFPIGTTHVTLPRHDDHYTWQKVTSCIHNLLGGGQRWVDLYGEMIINNKDKCSCKLTFVKASYWSSKKYVVHGDVYDSDGVKVRHLFGAWHEAIFCGEDPDSAHCIWRTAPMPEDYEKYFSFSQYAIELNELEEGLKDKLPQTDCRFRPDQRLLEESFVQDAEVEKHRVEQIQREARAERERLGLEWKPNFFELREDESGNESWVSRGNYWELRETGFKDIRLPRLW